MKIVLLGGTGRVGSNLLSSALDKGHEVLAIARHPENIKTKHENLQIKNVNIFDEDVMAEELQGKDALVSCLGGSGSLFNRQPVTIYTDTAKIFANAMRRSGVNRLVVMSAWYISGLVILEIKQEATKVVSLCGIGGEEREGVPIHVGDQPLWAKPLISLAFKNPMQDMRDMETYLQENCSDLDTTAVKFSFGKGQNETGKPILTHEGQSVPGAGTFITYGDLSKFIIENCLQKGEWCKKLVSIGTT